MNGWRKKERKHLSAATDHETSGLPEDDTPIPILKGNAVSWWILPQQGPGQSGGSTSHPHTAPESRVPTFTEISQITFLHTSFFPRKIWTITRSHSNINHSMIKLQLRDKYHYSHLNVIDTEANQEDLKTTSSPWERKEIVSKTKVGK